jgi:nitrogenase-stabilizing/protective protein
MMGVLDDLKQLSAAEEFFQYLGVDYQPSVLNIARLHILKRMGQYLASEAAQGSDDELRARCAQHLAAAYADFVASSPLDARLFKVHQDAVKAPAPKADPFVTLQPLRRS